LETTGVADNVTPGGDWRKMKVAILADIHCNWPALQAVVEHVDSWRPDAVVVAGDMVNRGPRPRECLQFVQEKQRTQGWRLLRGNHEEYVVFHSQPDAPRSGPEFEVFRNSYWTYRQLNGDVATLAALPFAIDIADLQGEVRVTHASMRSTRDGIYPETPDDVLRHQLGTPTDVLAVGHTHRPLIRRVDGTLVVNAGSVGLPFDGDPRASYAQVTWHGGQWHARIVRLGYDRKQAERDFFDTGYVEGAGPLARLILVELREARSQLYQWTSRYQARVLAGEMTVEAAVDAFLQNGR